MWAFDAEANKWNPTLVILRINRAATHVRWSPEENKFAVASGAKVVSVCHFEEDNDWWVSKHIKKHRSTVTKVAWHPNNQLLATGSTDSKCRVVSCQIKGIDRRLAASSWAGAKPPPFGEVVCEVDCGGWVHGVAFSPSGDRLAFVGHDATVGFVDAPATPGAPTNPCIVKLSTLPQMDVLFVDENRAITVGHDCQPLLFTSSGPGAWAFTKNLDEKPKATGGAAARGGPGSANAFDIFKTATEKGTTDSNATQTVLETKHQNTITMIIPFSATGGVLAEYSTSGLDGAVIVWRV